MSNKKGRFGTHGGQYIPETLMNAVNELEEAYEHYKNNNEFTEELSSLFNEYAGRPSLLYFAEKMTDDLGGAKIYLKREDLNHTGSHKINNVLGQALLAKKNGKDKAYSRDRCRTAWCGYSYGSSTYGDGMRHFYGRGRYKETGAKRISHEAFGSRGCSCKDRNSYP